MNRPLLLLACWILARIIGAFMLPIGDCDETFNYWEPSHWLLFGTGKQTWEYAPPYALRSWGYLWLHMWPSWLTQKLIEPYIGVGVRAIPKPFYFYGTKVIIALTTMSCELYFVSAVRRVFGITCSTVIGIVLITSPGMWQMAAAFLPSTTSMMAGFIAGGAWLRLRHALDQQQQQSVVSSDSSVRYNGTVAIAAVLVMLVAWPFAAFVAVPIVLDVLYISLFRSSSIQSSQSGGGTNLFLYFVRQSILIAVVLFGSIALVDSYYFCRPVFSPLELVRYNVFGQSSGAAADAGAAVGADGGAAEEERGSHLYGVEPWHFFFRNLTLNFTTTFILALISPGIVGAAHLLRLATQSKEEQMKIAMAKKMDQQRGGGVKPPQGEERRISLARVLLTTSPFFLWFVFWLKVPHKEERFFAPAYPFLALSGSITFSVLLDGTAIKEKKIDNDKNEKNKVTNTSNVSNTSPSVEEKSPFTRIRRFLIGSLLLLTVLVNLGRVGALSMYYRGPEAVAYALHQHLVELPPYRHDHSSSASASASSSSSSSTFYSSVSVCVGRDWYKFPSSFFLPHNNVIYPNDPGGEFRFRKFTYRFANEFGFDGALPLDFAETTTATTTGSTLGSCAEVPAGVNDLNRRVPGSIVPIAEMDRDCDFFFGSSEEMQQDIIGRRRGRDDDDVDVDVVGGHDDDVSLWSPVVADGAIQSAILSTGETPTLCRILYIPFVSERCAKWMDFLAWKRNN